MITTRVGFGYDMHKLEEGSYIMLGGIRIDSNHTVIAHSDGDIVPVSYTHLTLPTNREV